jgi:hypothetical protein
LDNGTKTRLSNERSWSLFKLMVSVENTRKGFVAMNEALKKEVEAGLE